MKQFSRPLLVVLGLGVFVSALYLPPPPVSAERRATPVDVENTPLPVQGTVSAAQSGTWNVGITGTPSVNVGRPTVNLGPGSTVGINGSITVGNSSTNPVLVRDLDNPAHNPLVRGFGCTLAALAFCNGNSGTPAFQSFVVENVLVDAFVATGATPRASFTFVTGGAMTGVTVPFKFLRSETTTQDHYQISSPVYRLYLDPNSPVTVSFSSTSVNSAVEQSVVVTLIGHTVACGTATMSQMCPMP